MRTPVSLVCLALMSAVACAADDIGESASSPLCKAARDHASRCFGSTLPDATNACDEGAAEALLGMSCDEVVAEHAGKADWLCWSVGWSCGDASECTARYDEVFARYEDVAEREDFTDEEHSNMQNLLAGIEADCANGEPERGLENANAVDWILTRIEQADPGEV